MNGRALVFTVVLLGLGTAATPSAALPACPKRPKEADQARTLAGVWWRSAIKFFKAKQYRNARRAWQCSYQLKPHPLALFNIARAADLGREPGVALGYYQAYLKVMPATQDAAELKKKISRLAAVVVRMRPPPRIPVVDVPMELYPQPADPRQTTTLDPRQPSPEDPVPPEIRSAPRPPTRRVETRPVTAGARRVVPREAVSPNPPPARRRKAPLLKILGWSAVGLGVALGGTSVAFSVLANKARGNVEDSPPGTTWRDVKSDYDRYETYRTMTYALAGAAGAVAVAGLVMLILDGTRKERRVAATPVVLPGGGGFTLQARF
ncbi:MAG: hypothetical protein ABI333_14525 [bacterium]